MTSSSLYALVDGNNFYCSCERVFRPSLNGHPLIVLSNNDGCAIARSNEAKSLGIKMGQPWHEVRQYEESHGLIALSANFELYGDLSDRMMSIVSGLGPHQEIYSIDESFVELTGVRHPTDRAKRVRQRVLDWVGIPCCVGMGATKTLAKLANHIAKTAERKPGLYPTHLAQVCNLSELDEPALNEVLASTDVGEVWGIGRRISAQLQEGGVNTVLDLKLMDLATARRGWSVVLERTILELNGVSCIPLELEPPTKKEIASTRSFGQPVFHLDDLAQAISTFASRACEKLRQQHSHCGQVLVFIRTSPFRVNDAQYSNSLVIPLTRHTDDTQSVVSAALMGLRAIYKSGFKYAKAGVMLLDLMDASAVQSELDLNVELDTGRDRSRLWSAVDLINQRFGKGAMAVGTTPTKKTTTPWAMKQSRRTPRYTTKWDELPVVRM